MSGTLLGVGLMPLRSLHSRSGEIDNKQINKMISSSDKVAMRKPDDNIENSVSRGRVVLYIVMTRALF